MHSQLTSSLTASFFAGCCFSTKAAFIRLFLHLIIVFLSFFVIFHPLSVCLIQIQCKTAPLDTLLQMKQQQTFGLSPWRPALIHFHCHNYFPSRAGRAASLFPLNSGCHGSLQTFMTCTVLHRQTRGKPVSSRPRRPTSDLSQPTLTHGSLHPGATKPSRPHPRGDPYRSPSLTL